MLKSTEKCGIVMGIENAADMSRAVRIVMFPESMVSMISFGSGVACPKKSGGPKKFSLLVSSKSYNKQTWDPHIKKKLFNLFNGIVLFSGGV